MTRDSAVLLRHIMLCLARISEYTTEGREAFLRDTKTQDAVIRNLEIIGQAVRDLGVDELVREFPSVRWLQIAGMRNVLAHQYLGVDISLVWKVADFELSQLRDAVKPFWTAWMQVANPGDHLLHLPPPRRARMGRAPGSEDRVSHSIGIESTTIQMS